ncbi:Sulfate transporter 1.3 [Morus notabilis]|uniref:Sulfate transporter 1.3 n=1 Tax=Morus notabilis TaxID=981085 RepID=W9SH49_9ROSA|nr:Sulfate transporter 1.3 [Morus notabilis]
MTSSTVHSASDQALEKSGEMDTPPGSERYMHKVSVPPKQNLLKEFTATVKETFFADDPLRPFKDQSKSRKLILGIQAIFPILEWSRSYSLKKFRGDLIAGLTIASLCIPQDIGYAKLANLAPQYGLYSSFVPPLIYACMGSSRDIAIGPVAVVSLLLGTLLQNEVDHTTNPTEYLRLAFTATFFAGITQATLGILRLGFLIDFLSHAAIVGFMGGAAITIALQQLKGFLGIKKFTKKTDIISVMHSVFGSAHHGWNWQTIVIGATFLSFLLVAKYIGKKNKKLFWVPAIAPLISVILSTFFVYITHAEKKGVEIGKKNKKLFWVPAIAPLISVILSTFFVYITHAEKKGVEIVRHLEKGINPSSVDQIYFSGEYLGKGFKIGVVAGMIALTEATAIGRTFASMKDYTLDGNKEMIALGAMNVVGSMTSCYVATGSFSRSAVNYMAGCSTAVSNIVMSCVVFLTLEFITPLFKYTPNAILSAIIINAVLNLIDIQAAILIWKVDKFDFVACMGAFFGVVFSSVEMGLLIAVSISFAKILLQVTRPRTALLGKIPRTAVYRNIQQYPDASKVPGVLIVRVDSAIYFSNSNYVKERILRWLTDEEERKKAAEPTIHFLIVEMSPVTDIDTSGIHALEELYRSLQKRNVQLILANPGPVVIDKLHESKFETLIGEDKIFLTVADAVAACSPKKLVEEV